MKKYNFYIILIICIVLILNGCSKKIRDFYIEGYGDIQVFEKLINKVNIKRQESIINSRPIDISKYTSDFKNEVDAFSDNDVKSLITYRNPVVVTKDEAIKDIKIAFKLLKYSYGAYEYFGGDIVFEKVIVQMMLSRKIYLLLI